MPFFRQLKNGCRPDNYCSRTTPGASTTGASATAATTSFERGKRKFAEEFDTRQPMVEAAGKYCV
jgi:hypothetical protein